MKNKNGITLIALIITIIIMLILAAVTINITLKGGLITKAKNASVEMEKQAIYEQLLGLMELNDDGTIYVKGTYDTIKLMYGNNVVAVEPTESNITTSTESILLTIKGKSGTYKYRITTNNITNEVTSNEASSSESSQTKRQLVLGKKYEGTFMYDENRIVVNVYFTRFNHMYVKSYYNETPFLTGWDGYTLNETTGAITGKNTMENNYTVLDALLGLNAIVQEGNRTIKASYQGEFDMEYILTDEDFVNQPVKLTHIDAYNGIYYNRELDKIITINADEKENIYEDSITIFVEADGSNTYHDIREHNTYEDVFERDGVTIIDSKTLMFDGEEYILYEEQY